MTSELKRAKKLANVGILSACVLLAVAMPAAATGWERGERPSRAEVPLPKGQGFEVAKGSVGDPVGDTFGTGTPQIDIIGMDADLGGGNVVVTIDFDGAISPADSSNPNAVAGFIDIDADQNGATGDISWVDFLTGTSTSGMGNEYYVDVFSYSSGDGAVDVVDDLTELVVGRAPASFTADSLTVTIPVSFLGGDDGVVNVAAVMGTIDEPTDIVPNSGSVATGQQTSILLNDDRFRVSVVWSSQQFPDPRPAFVSNLRTDDSGIFYFLDDDNLEFLIKVLNGCSITDHYWVFFAATTDVEFTVTVTDTQAGLTNTYTNPLGQPADAVTDTTAFATCP